MKTSWIIGVVMWWIVGYICASIIQANNAFGSTQTSLIKALFTPAISDSSNALITVFANIGTYIKGFFQLLFLYFPSVWVGQWVWIWFIFAVPIAIGIIMTIVFIMRGVSNG